MKRHVRLMISISLLAASPAIAADSSPLAAVDVDDSQFKYIGIDNCARCHSNGRPSGEWMKMNESDKWEKEDKHALAFKLLDSPVGAQMSKILGYKVTEDKRCLSCHSPFKDEQSKTSQTFSGVNCEGCHGPSGGAGAELQNAWLIPHTLPTWRFKSPAEKAKSGMRDMRDPVAQALQCASCHIGDVSKGRLVTHEMYAAGHPPLPSIEVSTFSHLMPQHWIPMHEKAKVLKDKELDEFKKHYQLNASNQANLILVSSLVNLRQSMKLLADGAKEGASKKDWPRFENFDCYACHHDLQDGDKAWRQQRAPLAGVPGRPIGFSWPLMLARSAAREIGPDAEASLLLRMDGLNKGLSARPFGDPTMMQSGADAVIAECDQLLGKVSSKVYTKDDVRQLALRLCDQHMQGSPDYESARQVGWALQSLARELGVANGTSIDKLSKNLRLDIPAGQHRQIMKDLEQSLLKLNGYAPSQFRTDLQQVRAVFAAP